METSHFPVLSLLIFLPLAAGIGLFGVRSEQRVQAVALGAALLELFLALVVLGWFDATRHGMQFLERHPWIPSLNIEYLVGIDGVSVLFLPLSALLTVAVIAASWRRVHTLPRLYYAQVLALESATVGIFCALDLGLFFLFWELTLPLLFFLISLWGTGPRRRYAATQYTLFMLAGGVPLLFGFILLALNHARHTAVAAPQGLSFDYLTLLDTPIPAELQTAIFLLLFLGFAVKAPLFPFHGWLPTAAMEGPAGISAFLMGLKLGLYGIIRFAVPLAPQAAAESTGLMAMLGVTGVVYGALIALRQSNLRRMLAFSSISHVGFVLIGIAALNIQGIQGAVFQLFNFGIVAAGIFLLAGFLQHRLGSTELTALGGAARPMPLLAAMFFILGLAGIGVPGTVGFPAEHLVLIGAFSADSGMGLAALLGIVLSAGYFFRFFQRAFLGPVSRPAVDGASDLRPRELTVAVAMVSLSLGIGWFPQGILEMTKMPLNAWVMRVESDASPTLMANTEPEGSG